jgi:hypothetical protein
VPEPAPAPPWHSQEQLANITAENSPLRISGVVHELMHLTSLKILDTRTIRPRATGMFSLHVEIALERH